jgi:transposase
MKKYLCYAGIDVSKSKLDVSLLTDALQRSTPHLIVPNDGMGIKKLLGQLAKDGFGMSDVLFTFEDTGIYSLPLACYLSEHGLDYWMVPAIEIKRSKGISRGKTDKTDSRDIAFYSMTHQHKLRLGQIPEKEIMKLKLLFSEREKLMGAIHLMESTQEMQGFIPRRHRLRS